MLDEYVNKCCALPLNKKVIITKTAAVRKQQLRKHLIIEMCICLHQLCNSPASCREMRSFKLHC